VWLVELFKSLWRAIAPFLRKLGFSKGSRQMQSVNVRLSDFFAGVHRNSQNFLVGKRELASLAQDISDSFAKALHLPSIQSNAAIAFLAMSHASYLAAVQLSSSGQLPASYMASRGTLEGALYGWYVNEKPQLKQVWSTRHHDDAARRMVRESFKIGEIRTALRQTDKSVEAQFATAYETAIDLGAHPNSLVLFTNLTVPDPQGGQTFQYVNTEPATQELAILTSAHAGVTALILFGIAFRTEFAGTEVPSVVLSLQQRLFAALARPLGA
jgi:hypothetical protein